MSEQLNELNEVIKKYSLERIQIQAEAFIAELFTRSKLGQRELNLLAAAIRERVVVDLLEFQNLLDQAVLFERLATRLYEFQGIRKDLAEWSVAAWIQILKTDTHPKDENLYQNPPNPKSYELNDNLNPTYFFAAMNIRLTFLQPIYLKKEVFCLKKQRYRVAIMACPASKHILGIRKTLISKERQHVLKSVKIKSSLPALNNLFKMKDLELYDWFQLPDLKSLKQAVIDFNSSDNF